MYIMDYEGNANTAVLTPVWAPPSHGHSSPLFIRIRAVLNNPSGRCEGRVVTMQCAQVRDQQAGGTKAVCDSTTRRDCVPLCAVGWRKVPRSPSFRFAFLCVFFLPLTTGVFLLASGVLYSAYAASSRRLSTPASAQSMRGTSATITAAAGTSPSTPSFVGASTDAAENATSELAGYEKTRGKLPVRELSYKVHELTKHSSELLPPETVQGSVPSKAARGTPLSVQPFASRSDTSGRERHSVEEGQLPVAQRRKLKESCRGINQVRSLTEQQQFTSVQQLLQKESGCEDSSDAEGEDSDAPPFEGLALAGQILGLATDFDGTMVSGQDESEPYQPRDVLGATSTSASCRSTVHEKSQHGHQHERNRNRHASKEDDEIPATQGMRLEGKEDDGIDPHAESIASSPTVRTGSRGGSTATTASSTAESSCANTCLTLWALGRKYAEDNGEYDELVRVTQEAYSDGLNSIYRQSRLLKLETDRPRRDGLPAGEGESDNSGRGTRGEGGAVGHENQVETLDLKLRQQLLDELVSAMDTHEEKMTNTTEAWKFLKGIPRTSLETDILQVPNNIDCFKPGVLQTIVRAVSLKIPVTIISHSWSSALITATLRHALNKAVAGCKFKKSELETHVTSRNSSSVMLQSTPLSAEGPASEQQRPSPQGGFPREKQEYDDVRLLAPVPGAVDLHPKQVPAANGEGYRAQGGDGNNPSDSFVASGMDCEITASMSVDRILRDVTVPGNELVFHRGISTGVVRRRCVTLRAKAQLLQKAREDRLKQLQKLHSLGGETDAVAHPLSAPGKAQHLAVHASHDRHHQKEAHQLPVFAQQQHLWMVYLGDRIHDIAALLAADIGILVGTPPEPTLPVLQAAGVVVQPLSLLIDEFKRQAVRRNKQRLCGLSKGDVTPTRSRAVASLRLDSRGSGPEPSSSDISSTNVGQRQSQKSLPEPHAQVSHLVACWPWNAGDQQRFSYRLPGDGTDEWNVSQRSRRHVIYNTLDWREVHILFFGSPP